MVQEVAGGVVVSEPVTSRLLPAPHLTCSWALSEPVMAHDVVLGELAGPLLEVLTALRSRGGGVAGRRGGGACRLRVWRPGTGGDIRSGGT